MKKLLTLFCAGALIGALGTACNNGDGQGQDKENENENEIQVVPVSDEVADFFNKYFPGYSSSEFQSDFFPEANYMTSVCHIINSIVELQEIAPSSIDLPSIDFDRYTLVIGQSWARSPGYDIINQGIDVKSENMKLNLTLDIPYGVYPAEVCPLYYWGIYEKLPQKSIDVNVTYK